MSSSNSIRTSARPWRKDSLKPLHQPLIPEDLIDIGTQRTIVSGLFAVLQAYKLYDLFALSNSASPLHDSNNIFFVIKFYLIEAAFLLLLPVFRIPWLTLTFRVTVILIASLTLLNILLSIGSSFSASAILMGIFKTFFDSELSISGKRVRSRDLLDSTSHLSGRHTVHILPESTALFNPSLQSFCLENSYSEVYVPIRLNATDPIFIQLNSYDLGTQEMTVHEFTKKEIKKLKMPIAPEKLDDPRLSYYALPVSKPGLYRITKITDISKLNIRLYRSDVLVSRCPSAFISSGTDADGSHRCVGDVDVPKISLDGVPPLKVKYSKSVKGQEKTITVQSVNSKNANSSHLPTSGKQSFFWKNNEPLSWASSQSVEVEMDTALSTTGDWVYYIDEVEDALGNLVNYTQIYNNRENPRLLFSKSLAYGFMVHPRPQISFKGCSPENPIKLRKGSTTRLPITINEVDARDGPFKAEFEYVPLEDSIGSSPQFSFSNNFTKLVDSINVKDSGMYKMLDFEGNYCKGTVLEPATCLVYVPPEPEINVEFSSLEDKCAGPIGVTADIALSGTPPFVVNYRMYRDNTIVKNEYKIISQTREKLEFKPTTAGNYKYEFYRLGDDVYKNIELRGTGFSTVQTIRTLAGASFVKSEQKRKCCSGDTIDLQVKLNGVPPFKLDYEIIYGASKRTSYTKSGIPGTILDIVTPPLKQGGPYTVSLVSVQDSHGCVTSLNERDVNIDVRRQRPAAAFLPLDGSMELKTLEGRNVGLPLKLSGEGPWDITYRQQREDGSVIDKSTTKHKSNGEVILVDEMGVYSLLTVKDAYCPGEISGSKPFDISWVEKPQLSVINSTLLVEEGNNVYEKHAICENDEDVLELGLTGELYGEILLVKAANILGSSPFTIYYDVTGPRNYLKQKFAVATKYASLGLQNSKAGDYAYTFTGVSDGIYSQDDLKAFAFDKIVVKQTVNSRPTASFPDRGKIYKICVNTDPEDSTVEPIPISFTGNGPFTVSLTVQHESTGKSDKIEVKGVTSKKHLIRNIYEGLGLGKHTIRINSISDGNGCGRSFFKEDERVYIFVSDVPYLTQLNAKTDYCVGERIEFALNGVAPFEISYDFGGVKQKAATRSPFSRLAASPGNLTLLTLSDSSSSCQVKLPAADIKHIHEIPSVEVSEGTTIIQDIHEGDQAEIIFHLKGTPPFTFVYTRSECVGRRCKIVETTTVPNVQGYEYSIYTSMQGTYEAIAIEDKFCSYTGEGKGHGR